MKQTKTQNKVLKAGTGYLIGNYLLKGITFLSAPIFTRLLTVEEYGVLGAYTSYEGILYIIVGLALHTSITNAKYKYKENFDEYISSIVAFTMIATSIWLILANLFYDEYAAILDFSRLLVNILILHCFGSSMIQFFNSYVSLNYKVKSFLKLTSINALANMGLSIVLLLTLFTNSRLLGRVIGIVFSLLCIAIYIVQYFFKKSKPVIKFDYWKFALSYSLPMIPHGISQVILSSFDRIMINNMLGASEAGLYSFSYTINTLVIVGSQSLHNVWKPWIYEKMDQKDYVSIKKQGTKYALGVALFTCLVIISSPELIKLLGAKEYWNSASCVVPVVIGGYFSFIYTLPVMIEYFYGKTKFIALGTILAAGLNIILNYIFIPRYGYIAAAYTTMITYFLYFLFHFMLAAHVHGKSIYSMSELLGISMGIVVVGGVTLLTIDYVATRWIICVVVAIYCLIWADKNFNLRKLVRDRFTNE